MQHGVNYTQYTRIFCKCKLCKNKKNKKPNNIKIRARFFFLICTFCLVTAALLKRNTLKDRKYVACYLLFF